MKITVSRKSFAHSWGLVSSLAPEKHSNPAITHIKVEANSEGHVVLSATDLNLSLRLFSQGATVHRNGVALLPAAKIGKILGSGADAELNIDADKDRVTIKGDHSKFTMETLDPLNFPEPAAVEAQDAIEVRPLAIKRLIRRTAFAVDPSAQRYALGGCLVEAEEGQLAFIATDGRRLAKASSPAGFSPTFAERNAWPVIPIAGLKLIEKILAERDDHPDLLSWDHSRFKYSTPWADVRGRLLEGRFPAYRQIFPNQEPMSARLSVPNLRQAVALASITADPDGVYRGIDLEFTPGALVLHGQSPDRGESRISEVAEFDHDIKLRFDPQYLIEPLKAVGDVEDVTVRLIDDKSATVFEFGEDYQVVVMPLSLE